MTQALYRKWRPHQWDEIIGQDHVVQTIHNAVSHDRIGHAYLFSGPRGTGKTTMARLLAKAANCTAEDLTKRPCDQCVTCKTFNDNRFLDLIEIDAASNTSVDDVRDLRDKINFSPSLGKYKVYIIDEVHMLSTAAFNALLKTLEEPPRHAIFILATTEVNKIPPTVLSRCQRHEFRRITVGEINSLMERIVKEEGFSAEEEALTLIARQATGSMRDAISMLDQIASTGEKITLKATQEILGTATSLTVIELIDAILMGDIRKGHQVIDKALDGGSDPRQLARQVVDHLRSILLIRNGNKELVDATPEICKQMSEQAEKFTQGRLLACIQAFNQAATDRRSSLFPGLPLELATVECVEGLPAVGKSVYIDNQQAINIHIEPEKSKIAAPATETANKHEAEKSTVEQPQHDNHEIQSAPKIESIPENLAISKPQAQQETVTYEKIDQNWERIKTAVKGQRGGTIGLLNVCKYKTVQKGVLVLGFASDILKRKMEGEENIQITRKAIQQTIGMDIPIECIVLNSKATSSDGKLDSEGDGMVGEALNLGGKITRKE